LTRFDLASQETSPDIEISALCLDIQLLQYSFLFLLMPVILHKPISPGVVQESYSPRSFLVTLPSSCDFPRLQFSDCIKFSQTLAFLCRILTADTKMGFFSPFLEKQLSHIDAGRFCLLSTHLKRFRSKIPRNKVPLQGPTSVSLLDLRYKAILLEAVTPYMKVAFPADAEQDLLLDATCESLGRGNSAPLQQRPPPDMRVQCPLVL
jgi:hypothetical protein